MPKSPLHRGFAGKAMRDWLASSSVHTAAGGFTTQDLREAFPDIPGKVTAMWAGNEWRAFRLRRSTTTMPHRYHRLTDA